MSPNVRWGNPRKLFRKAAIGMMPRALEQNLISAFRCRLGGLVQRPIYRSRSLLQRLRRNASFLLQQRLKYLIKASNLPVSSMNLKVTKRTRVYAREVAHPRASTHPPTRWLCGCNSVVRESRWLTDGVGSRDCSLPVRPGPHYPT